MSTGPNISTGANDTALIPFAGEVVDTIPSASDLSISGVGTRSTRKAAVPNKTRARSCTSSPFTSALEQINRIDLASIAVKDFTDANELKQAYDETHAAIEAASKGFLAKNEELIRALARMRTILSQRGKDKLKKEAGIKWKSWGSYFRWFKKTYNYKYCLRTVVNKIDELAGKKLCTECKKAGGHLPSCSRHPQPIPYLNKAARKALLEGNHRAVELVADLEAGRDPKEKIAAFKAVMNAKRLDDILTTQAAEEAAKTNREFSWADLQNRLSALLPISCDGVEHTFVERMSTAVLAARTRLAIDPTVLADVAHNCQRLSARFSAYAKLLDPNASELSASAIAEEAKNIEANLPYYKAPAPPTRERKYRSRGNDVYYYDDAGKKVVHSKVSSNTEAVVLAKSLNEFSSVPEKSVAN